MWVLNEPHDDHPNGAGRLFMLRGDTENYKLGHKGKSSMCMPLQTFAAKHLSHASGEAPCL